MFNWLKKLFIYDQYAGLDPQTRVAAQSAVALVKASENCRYTAGVRLRADETNRWVFVVFFVGPMPERPAPYRLIAVNKTSGEALELAETEESRYRLKNHK